jgi:hypothetical protein
MNLREICRERDYTTVIGTTYSFNPIFFERVILPDLRFGQGREIVLIGDSSELTEAINRCNYPLRQIGNTIITESVHLTGAFHPKILLKIGKNGAILTIGSGNMTNGGWGDNQELFAKWVLSKNDPKAALVVKKVINSLSPFVKSELTIQALNKTLDYNWVLGESNEDNNLDFFITEPDKSLSDLLIERWAGKQFHTLKLFTGSTDQNGAFIEWCHKTLGIKTCVIATNENHVGFDKDILNKIPVDISISPIDSNQMMHSKFYLFEGDNENSVVMGSANCSRRAWLMAPDQGGNVEAVAVYDDVDKNEFLDIISRFPNDKISINELNITIEDSLPDPKTTDLYKITCITLDRFTSELKLELREELPDQSNVQILINDVLHPLTPYKNNKAIWGTSLVDIPGGQYNETLFAEVIFDKPGENTVTQLHWINDLAKIKSASKNRRINDAARNFFDAKNDTEYGKALRELTFISNIILDDPDSFDDPVYITSRSKENKDDEKVDAKPLTSASLYKSIADIEVSSSSEIVHGGQINTSLSFAGIMNFFFSFQDELTTSDSFLDEESDGIDLDAENEPDKNKPGSDEKDEKKRTIDERFRKRLAKQMDQYFDKFRSESFREHCTVSQLKQAAAYPLVITVFGKRNGWVEKDLVEQWVTTTIDILFKIIIGSHNGLLDFVKERSSAKNQLEIFNRVVGDGTLWIALLTAIEEVEWNGENGYVNKALAISAILDHQTLLASAEPGQMEALIKKHKFKQTAEWIIKKPIKSVSTLKKIINYIIRNFDQLMINQLEKEHIRGDLLFGKNIGWGLVLDERITIYSTPRAMNVYLHKRGKEKKVKSHGFFINIRIAQENDNKLSKLISNLEMM